MFALKSMYFELQFVHSSVRMLAVMLTALTQLGKAVSFFPFVLIHATFIVKKGEDFILSDSFVATSQMQQSGKFPFLSMLIFVVSCLQIGFWWFFVSNLFLLPFLTLFQRWISVYYKKTTDYQEEDYTLQNSIWYCCMEKWYICTTKWHLSGLPVQPTPKIWTEASQGRKKKERLWSWHHGGWRSEPLFLWEGNRLLGQIDRDGQFVELGLLDDAGSIQQSGSRTPSVWHIVSPVLARRQRSSIVNAHTVCSPILHADERVPRSMNTKHANRKRNNESIGFLSYVYFLVFLITCCRIIRISHLQISCCNKGGDVTLSVLGLIR